MGEGYTPPSRTGFGWGCATAWVVSFILIPIALLIGMGMCPRGADDCYGDTFVLIGALVLCALIGLGVGAIAHALTRRRGG